ncbi:RICIN domain-containing protein [Saccharopolyspora erythraea]|uniref:RICIN domain-containing protein n=1 Tax=Saccharopolyspora erythraea TaxID=1836 RepID=UPI00138B1906|nr:RICIN domain-containing protein [Saccharopolyspora erythraea]QRK88020.1 RICIN domain-containing protein [Saccharopolyspora erythraea]
MAGTVGVGLVIVDGPTAATKFTLTEMAEVVAEVQNGLTWLATQSPGAPLTFSHEIKAVSVTADPLPLVGLKAKHSKKVLEVKDSSITDGAQIVQSDDDGGHNQHFSMEPVGDGYVRFVAEQSNKVLDVKDASTANGALLTQRSWHGGDNQRFRVEDQGNGDMRITAKHSGKVLDVEGISTADGARLQQWDWLGGDNQRFLIDLRGDEREARWRDPAVAALGHQGNWNGVHDYVQALRRRLGTEWAYCVFFTKYPLWHFAYAGVPGGPRVVMDYNNGDWGPSNIDRVFAHETGHIFGCPDEYREGSNEKCGGIHGYWRTPNDNFDGGCVPGGGVACLMRKNTWATCEYTASHLGWTSPWALGTALISKHSGKALHVKPPGSNGTRITQQAWDDGIYQRFRFDPLGDGYYRIANHMNGKVLDVDAGSTADGARIVAWSWHGGDNQRFRLEPLGNGEVRLVAKHSGKALDVHNASTADGGEIVQWSWHGGANQRFHMRGVPIFVGHSGKVLDVKDGSTVNGALLTQWDHHGGNNQLFRAEPLGNYALPNTQYRLVAEHSGKVLTIANGSIGDGSNVVQWDWYGGNEQRFRIEPTTDGRVRIVASHSGKALSVKDAATANGAQIVQMSAHGGANQAFRLLGARITAKHSGRALDIEGNLMTDRARLTQWDWHGGNNQRFRLEPLGDVGTYRIVVESNGRVLDVLNASTDDGATVVQFPWHGGSHQRFRLQPLGDGYHRIVAVHSGKVLEVQNSSTANGALVTQRAWHGGDNQRFRL